MKTSQISLTCDWCKTRDVILSAQNTSVQWGRVEVFQLVGSESAATWELCPDCIKDLELLKKSREDKAAILKDASEKNA